MASEKKNIVVIGGGYGGVKVARELEKTHSSTYQIILIEKRSHLFHAIAALRGAVVDMDDKLFIPYSSLFKRGGKVVQAEVVSIGKTEVVVSPAGELGEKIPFEYLIIATGSSYPAPAKLDGLHKEQGAEYLRTTRKSVSSAESILIIGGGPVGVEFAAEIKTVYPTKKVTIVHLENQLIGNKYPAKFHKYINDGLANLGVEVVLGESIEIPQGGFGNTLQKRTLVTNKGREIESDLQFVAFGVRPNSSLITTLDPTLLNPTTKCIKVQQTLQLPGYDHIFALGDVADLPEGKLAYRAGQHADVVIQNIAALIKNSSLTEYKPMGDAILVTLGPNGGVSFLPMFGGITLGNWVSKTMKSSHLFIPRFWGELGATVPN